MQQVLILALIAAALAGALLLGGVEGPQLAPSPTPTKPVERGDHPQLKLKIGDVVAWNSSPVDVPVSLTGNPEELQFVIRFPPHVARVLSVESSANWDAWIVRSNADGEILVRAERLRSTAGTHRLLMVRFHRIANGSAPITIPADTVVARFPSQGSYDVKVDAGAIRAPF